MIRYIVLLRRCEGVSREEFLRSWLDDHAALAKALPGVQELAFHPCVNDAEYDGVGYLTFLSESDLEHCLASESARRLRAHTATFADTASIIRTVVDTDAGTSWSLCGR